MMHKISRVKAALSLGFFLFILLTAAAYACCDDAITVDADDAFERSQRVGRAAVEGLWAVQIDWHPEETYARTYRLAIVRNRYDVFKDAPYIGVATCDKAGCVRGEVKLLLYPAKKSGTFDAVLVTGKGFARGPAYLEPDETGRKNSALDLREVLFGDKRMTRWMLRVKNG